ncbi:uncharacterized protein DDB_G0283697 [Lingula anatina]|uniref:Uncharacterized protein DDB_G0283697 n=1 Tax=Lingula anatina TaxID=7574 RepID=A0A1S3J5Q2_LINAN|nr:uncharacterized protein DDB_G0283697 [Lingula anatina]|eukprot:XP_013405633.1 uncharacterized protein DDB_G0283697 [Lingula anatina]
MGTREQSVEASECDELERLATQELMNEAKRGAERAKDYGSFGWLKSHVPPANKRFLANTLVSTLRNPPHLRRSDQNGYRRWRRHSSDSEDSDERRRHRSRSPGHRRGRRETDHRDDHRAKRERKRDKDRELKDSSNWKKDSKNRSHHQRENEMSQNLANSQKDHKPKESSSSGKTDLIPDSENDKLPSIVSLKDNLVDESGLGHKDHNSQGSPRQKNSNEKSAFDDKADHRVKMAELEEGQGQIEEHTKSSLQEETSQVTATDAGSNEVIYTEVGLQSTNSLSGLRETCSTMTIEKSGDGDGATNVKTLTPSEQSRNNKDLERSAATSKINEAEAVSKNNGKETDSEVSSSQHNMGVSESVISEAKSHDVEKNESESGGKQRSDSGRGSKHGNTENVENSKKRKVSKNDKKEIETTSSDMKVSGKEICETKAHFVDGNRNESGSKQKDGENVDESRKRKHKHKQKHKHKKHKKAQTKA